ncbi:MAG: S53 family peptidase, partial [Actinomycetes bacterium]
VPGAGPGQFLSVGQFAGTYGQTTRVIQQVEGYFGHYGISSYAYADRLDITLNGTAGQFDQAFTTQLARMHTPEVPATPGQPGVGAQSFFGPRTHPRLPSYLSNDIVAVLGLTNYAPFVSHAVSALPGLHPVATPTAAGAVPAGMRVPASFAKHYGLDPLYAQGATGTGQTLGIITLASITTPDVLAFWQQLNASGATPVPIDTSASRIALDNVDGGAGAPSLNAGSDETYLDVEQSGALATQAHEIVYQAPNTDYGFADAFYTAVSQNTAGSLSTSWGESETAVQASIAAYQESPGYQAAFDQAFMEAALQGQSTFAAAGDAGAYDASRDIGTTNLSVDTPGSSPYITAAGGTTLPGTQTYGTATAPVTVTIAHQRTWGWDYLWPLWQTLGFSSEANAAVNLVVGSGGGYSSLYPMPFYQFGVPGTVVAQAVPYLTPINNNTAWSFNPSPSVVTTSPQFMRATPDLAANADPQTGYAVYSSLFGTAFSSTAGYAQFGGTSFVAPQLNGATAVMESALGHRIGFWNPQIYRAAQSWSSPFTPLDTAGTSNDNIYYTGQQGAVFNPGSGLGTPNLAKLTSWLAGPRF